MTARLFLPGAGGSPHFWRGVADRLPPAPQQRLLGWPGLGDEPPDARVRGPRDLVALAEAALGEAPCDVLAQSMGGWVALQLALAHPERVRRLVLTGASAGVDVAALGGVDWRPSYRAAYPAAAAWITERVEDLTARLGEVRAPTLLVWGDRDDISPARVGELLRSLLPRATLVIVPGGDHDFVETHAEQVAPVIAPFLAGP